MKLEAITRAPKNQAHDTPLLFIHGMWHGAWCWDEFFLPFFADNGYQVTALSLRGHAGSEGKIAGSTIANYVSDVDQVAAPGRTRSPRAPRSGFPAFPWMNLPLKRTTALPI